MQAQVVAQSPPRPRVLVMLVIFALDVPLIIAFTVARYSSPPYFAD